MEKNLSYLSKRDYLALYAQAGAAYAYLKTREFINTSDTLKSTTMFYDMIPATIEKYIKTYWVRDNELAEMNITSILYNKFIEYSPTEAGEEWIDKVYNPLCQAENKNNPQMYAPGATEPIPVEC